MSKEFRNLFINSLNVFAPRIAKALAVYRPIEGTEIASTGETGGTKFLREDGDGTCSWQTVSGGSGTITALNNQAENRMVTIGSTTTELDGEANITYDGTTFSVDDSATFNESGNDNDFRVESVDETHMIFVEGSTNRVSIGDSTDSPAATLEVTNHATAGAYNVPLIQLNSNDTDQNALDINAANVDAAVIGVTADALTTAAVMVVSADALTTGGILNLVSDSSDTSTRTLVKVTNDNTAATGTTVMHLKSDAISSDNPILLVESTAADTGPVVQLKNTNAGTNREASLRFTRSDTSAEADDMDMGRISFEAVDSGNNLLVYASILAEASDVTDGDEGGKLTFQVAAGGTAGTAAGKNLFSIGGEDVANSDIPEVCVNDDGIDCDFRVESDNNTHQLYVDASTDAVGINFSSPKHGLTAVSDFNASTFENIFADGQGNGEILRYSPGADETLTAGQLYFLHTDGTWNSTDADAVATGATQLLGIGIGNARSVGLFVRGFIRIASTEILNVPGSGAVDGLPIYVSTTAGHLDFTAPSASGDFVRVVGYAIDDDGGDVLIYFNPDGTHVEIA